MCALNVVKGMKLNMNIQAMMKQAQKLQSDMMKAKDEIDKMEFSSTNGLVTVKINGKKEVLEVKIENDSDFSSDDLEMLQDMIVIATNDAMKQVDKVTEEKMGRFSSIPGLF